jgi:hypothetical protein
MKLVEQVILPPPPVMPRIEREAALEHLAVLRYGFEQNIIDVALARARVPGDLHEQATALIRRQWALIEPEAARSQPARLEAIARRVAADLGAVPHVRPQAGPT